jgi:alpha-2-macroglobulin
MASARITELPKIDEPVELLLELEYCDRNGEVQAVATSVPLWPTKWLVEVKTEAWVASKNLISAHIAVVDVYGQTCAKRPCCGNLSPGSTSCLLSITNNEPLIR